MTKTKIVYCESCGFAYECDEKEIVEIVDLHSQALLSHKEICGNFLCVSSEGEKSVHVKSCRGFVGIENGYMVLCDHPSHWK